MSTKLVLLQNYYLITTLQWQEQLQIAKSHNYTSSQNWPRTNMEENSGCKARVSYPVFILQPKALRKKPVF